MPFEVAVVAAAGSGRADTVGSEAVRTVLTDVRVRASPEHERRNKRNKRNKRNQHDEHCNFGNSATRPGKGVLR